MQEAKIEAPKLESVDHKTPFAPLLTDVKEEADKKTKNAKE